MKGKKQDCCEKPMGKFTAKRITDDKEFNILFCCLCGNLIAKEIKKK
jgi:hypothetical protein